MAQSKIFIPSQSLAASAFKNSINETYLFTNLVIICWLNSPFILRSAKSPYLSNPFHNRQSWTNIRFHTRCIILHDSLGTQGHGSIRSARKWILDRQSPRDHTPARCRNQLPLVLFTVPHQEWKITLCKEKSRPHAVHCFNIGRYNRDNTTQRNELNLLFQRKQTAYGNRLKIRGSEQRMRLGTVFPVSAVPWITQSSQISE